ncbi:hypothetical protein HBH56_197800 [Parastagonospora nodorum]|uniref:Uncharacterized protein n=1 Tax=Phaeosphaeria nodorum (strain SN15 / ATCC MYA-4574 / FGSC 10173) TaxID=321614 RepID=Q0UI25_PHANO|nr:hypothetical protein SNOG_08589 [Parastagonospora nodorum SN15]KAH3906804.1 hypothetical protein HBH56_197800 [Parastagonospora nodorum]EAT83757.1 hypothetical protein SNOG_08589 [Parastagonospora nodorum SN15]KAH3924630.1 hypothetical protein HBH54_190760 [Parastagonospora nodorum]KAH4130675.1 hypothetical protein HBH45_195440 [Parastagonospora nodorum]KAH4150358.1 hypothetical protein HBH44_181230 [Parastagonospora nodorum]
MSASLSEPLRATKDRVRLCTQRRVAPRSRMYLAHKTAMARLEVDLQSWARTPVAQAACVPAPMDDFAPKVDCVYRARRPN